MTGVDPSQTREVAPAVVPEAALKAGDGNPLDAALAPPSGGLAMPAAEAGAPPAWVGEVRAITDAGGLALLLTARAAWRLDVAGALVNAAALRWPSLAARRDGLRLALHEAVVNAVQHGCLEVPPEVRDGPEGLLAHARAMQTALDDPARINRPVLVTMIGSAQDMGGAGAWTARVRDCGPGFDPPATAAVMPGRDRTRGRGLALMAGVCDRVAWSDGGRTVTLTLAAVAGGSPESAA